METLFNLVDEINAQADRMENIHDTIGVVLREQDMHADSLTAVVTCWTSCGIS